MQVNCIVNNVERIIPPKDFPLFLLTKVLKTNLVIFTLQAKIIVPAAVNPNWRKARSWLAMKGITRKDLAEGSDIVEKLENPPWSAKNRVLNKESVGVGNKDKFSKKSNSNSPKEESLIGFGKYSTRTYSQLKDDDPRYFEWASENIPRFRIKAAELGLID